METVKVSSKYQLVIPRTIRRSLGIEPGQRLQVLAHGNRIEFIPVGRMKEMRGFLRRIDTTVPATGTAHERGLCLLGPESPIQ